MRNQKGFTFPELIMCLFFITVGSLVCGTIYTAIHFIAKFW